MFVYLKRILLRVAMEDFRNCHRNEPQKTHIIMDNQQWIAGTWVQMELNNLLELCWWNWEDDDWLLKEKNIKAID